MLAEITSPVGKRLGICVAATVVAAVVVFELFRFVIPVGTASSSAST